jgi:thioredoxin reductase (NADPH)
MTGEREVIIIGGGLAGLSAALYLGRSKRDTLLIHSGRSMQSGKSKCRTTSGFRTASPGSH